MRKTIIAALGVCFAVFVALSVPTHSPAFAQSATGTPAPITTGLTCQNIISRALEVLQNTCDTLSRNSACYGNASIQAQLTSADFSFQHPGDKVPVKIIKTVTTSPLNQNTGTWGLSLFKLQANLPDTLPGQNVTFLVFGDTSIQNVSGDMRAFYFSTGLGAPSCDAVPNDSILVRSPDHEQVTFNANGVTITIASTVRLKAVPNQAMTVDLIEGHATVSTPKGSRVLQPSQSVSISMGGATGLQAQGIPSPATDASPDTTTLDMVSSLNTVTQSDPSIPIKGCVTAINTGGITIGNVPVQMTADDLASRDLNVGDCLTVNADVQTDSSGNLVVVPTTETTGTTAGTTADNTGNGGNGNSGSNGNCDNSNSVGPAANPGGPKGGPSGNPPAGPGGPKGSPPGNPPPGPGDSGCPKAKPAGGPGGPGGKPPKGPPGGPPPGGPGKPPKGPGGPPPGGPGGPGGKKP